VDNPAAPATDPDAPWLTRSVAAIGFASLFSDACYEMIIPLLPAFIASLGGGPMALGLMEGVADGIAVPFKLVGGLLADRTRRRRVWTASGYLGVGIFMPAIALMHSVLGVIGMRSVAWAARGFRSPIKDTLLVDDTNPRFVNRAFGFQRALDTVGAVIGPAIGMALIASGVPVAKAIMVGVVPGVLAGTMYAFVREKPRTVPPRSPLHIELAKLPPQFLRYLLAAGVFGAGNFSPALLVLVATRALAPHVGATLAVAYATGLYLAHNALYAAATYPASTLSEKIGSGRLLAVAFALFATVGVVVALGSLSVPAVMAAFALTAIASAILEPMEGTFATGLLPADRRGMGFGALASVNGVGDFVSSAGVGFLWQFAGAGWAFGVAGAVCALGTAMLLPVVARRVS
jgi:MFS family permease